jgi:hypothetical protein
MGATLKEYLRQKWAVFIAVFFIYIAVHPFLTAFVGSLTGVYAPIKIWKDVVIAFIALVVLVISLSSVHLRRQIWSDNITRILAAYVVLTFGMFLYHRSFLDDSGFAGLIFNLRFIALFFAIYAGIRALRIGQANLRIGELRLKQLLIGIGSMVAFFGVLQVTVLPTSFMQFFGYDGVYTISPVSTVDNDPGVRRAFSVLRGPNELGAFLILPFVLVLERIFRRDPKAKIYSVCAIIIAIAIFYSHSRSAAIGLIVAVSVLVLGYVASSLSRKGIIGVFSAIAMVGLLIVLSASVYPPMRMIVFHSSPGDKSLIEGSTFDHFNASKSGVTDVIHNPLGRGVGEAGPASFYQTDGEQPRIAENYYIQIAQEVSVLGVILFIGLLGVIIRRLQITRPKANLPLVSAVLGLSAVAMLLHTWADDPTAYVAWALLAVSLMTKGETHERTTNKKAKRAA